MKHLSAKIQKAISNIVITEKNEKLSLTSEIPEIQGAFSDKVTPDIDGFTDEPVVQSQPAFTYSKLTIETLEGGVKDVQC